MQTILPAARPELSRALDQLGETRLDEARHYTRGPISKAQMRDSGGATGGGGDWRVFEGHATVFNQRTLLFEIPWGDGTRTRVFEVIESGAFDEVLAASPDVHFVDQHDMRLRMARTGVKGRGQLDLTADAVGLRTYAQINPALSYVADLEIAMTDGLVDQMSFCFQIGKESRDSHKDEDGNEDVLYTIHTIATLFEVSTVSQGAYPQTDAGLRYRSKIAAMLGGARTIGERTGSDPAATPEVAEERAGSDPAAASTSGTGAPDDLAAREAERADARRRREREVARLTYPRSTK